MLLLHWYVVILVNENLLERACISLHLHSAHEWTWTDENLYSAAIAIVSRETEKIARFNSVFYNFFTLDRLPINEVIN